MKHIHKPFVLDIQKDLEVLNEGYFYTKLEAMAIKRQMILTIKNDL